ncbi:hypothetical protein HDU92_001346 [Lobulomyces angularis]|nr:hypothetical protein HDU92_001346 [Lobulomyces angularis]
MEVNLLLWLVVPYIFSYLKRLLSKTPTHVIREKRRFSIQDKIVYYLLLVAIFNSISNMVIYKPNNILENLDIKTNTKSFIFRNKFREFMANKFDGWKERSPLENLQTFGDEKMKEISHFEDLYEKLKSNEMRKRYLRFGEKSFLNCRWCSEDFDHFYFILPDLAFIYSAYLAVIGFATLSWRKEQWRFTGAATVILISFVDIFLSIYCDDDDLAKTGYSPYLKAFYFRNFCFACLCFVIWFNDKKNEWTDFEILQNIFVKSQGIYSRANAVNLVKAAVMGDTNLRRKYFEYNKEKEAQKDLITKDSEFRKLRMEALQKYNLAGIISEADKVSKNILEMAKTVDAIPAGVTFEDDLMTVENYLDSDLVPEEVVKHDAAVHNNLKMRKS